MKKLPIDWSDLDFAFDNNSYDFNYYLDSETGEVLMVTSETLSMLEDLFDEYHDEENDQPADLAAVLPQTDLQDWQQEELLVAHRIEGDFGHRYLAIPQRDTHDAYNVMRDFIDTVENERLAESLQNAIRGRGAFRYFKDAIYEYPAEQKRWFAYRDSRLQEEILEWLEENDIEPLNRPKIDNVPEIEEPEPVTQRSEISQSRRQLLEEVVWFAQEASKIPGVIRIALFGSLTTDKTDPKDADVLVTITEEVSLKRLATLARKFSGHAQNMGLGADVFLADQQHHYLGRTCPWKRCEPGIRLACGALNCGRRQYLHDDLQDISLSRDIVIGPPVELWPKIISRVHLPTDTADMLQKMRGYFEF